MNPNYLDGFGALRIESLLIVLVVGIILALLFNLLNNNVAPYLKNKKIKNFLSNTLPVLELLWWFVFSVILIFRLVRINIIAGTILSAFLILIFYPIIKDVLAGLILRIEGKYNKGKKIKVNGYEGVIQKLGKRSIEIKIDKGETLVYPYSKFSSELIVQSTIAENVENLSLELVLPILKDFKPKLWLEKCINEMPWSINSKNPIIEVISKDDKEVTLRAVLYSIDQKYFTHMERYLKERIAKLNN